MLISVEYVNINCTTKSRTKIFYKITKFNCYSKQKCLFHFQTKTFCLLLLDIFTKSIFSTKCVNNNLSDSCFILSLMQLGHDSYVIFINGHDDRLKIWLFTIFAYLDYFFLIY